MDIEIKINELTNDEFKIVGTYSGSLVADLSNTFSVVNNGAFFAKQYGYKMPLKIYGVSPFGTFKQGLIFEIIKYLNENYSDMHITLSDEVKKVIAYRLPLRKFASSYKEPNCISTKIDMRSYQSEIIDSVIKKGYGRCMFECPTGCHAKGTNILMMDGSIKKVEDIVVGDRLVGDDGSERNVLQLCRGNDKMYRIIPTNGIPFVVNGNHILSLVRTDYHKNNVPSKLSYTYAKRKYDYDKTKDGYVIDISVNDYIKTSSNFKHLHKLYRSSSLIDFDNKQTSAFVNMLRTGFTVEELGNDDFYGFILDGNHRYVMADDGFVTHNSGKSFIIANLIYTLLQQYSPTMRTLLFLPNAQLVKQFYKDLLDYGYSKDDVLEFSANTYNKLRRDEINSKRIVISNRQFLFNHGNEIGKIDAMIIDEAHSASVASSQTAKFIQNMNAPIKIGCSGTIPTDLAKYWTLLNLIGPVVYKESITHLQDEGYLANVRFITIKVKDNIVENDKNLLFNLHPNVRYSSDGDSQIAFSDPYIAETEYMSTHCMELYSPILTNPKVNFSKTENTLILFDRIEFGKALYEFLKSIHFNDASIYYIDGSIPIDEREKIRMTCEVSQNVIIVAQVSIMSTGVNIKNLSNLVMTGSSKSQSRTIQSIGRTLRLHNDKTHATIWDIMFNYKYSKKHYLERCELYKKYYEKSKPDEVIKIEIGQDRPVKQVSGTLL